jgi:hypothetical protein
MKMEFNIDHTADLPSDLLIPTHIHDAITFEVAP